MNQVLLSLLLLLASFSYAREVFEKVPLEQNPLFDLVYEKSFQTQFMMTELDDMKELFPFKEKLDPKDLASCIEAIAKKQEEDFIQAHEFSDLKSELSSCR